MGCATVVVAAPTSLPVGVDDAEAGVSANEADGETAGVSVISVAAESVFVVELCTLLATSVDDEAGSVVVPAKTGSARSRGSAMRWMAGAGVLCWF